MVHNTLLSILCSFLWVAVRDIWCHRPPVGVHLARLEFSWHSPRSAPSLIGALVKKARRDDLPLLSFGNYFKAEVLLLALPVLHHSLAAAVSAMVSYWHNSHPDLSLLTGIPGLTSVVPQHCRLAVWSLDCVWLITASCPHLDLDLPISAPALCWWGQCWNLPY